MKKHLPVITLFFILLFGHHAANAQYSKLLDFNVANGSIPYADLYFDGTYLNGMTQYGGTNNDGVIFKLKTDGSAYTKTLNFSADTTGSYPIGSLITDGTFFYGMTFEGGCCGTIFKIKPDGTGYANLHNFSGGNTNGGSPVGSLIFDGTFLYGMTFGGSVNNLGTVFKIKPDGTGFTILYSFSGSADGQSPYGSLITDGTYLYGMTYGGGTYNFGVIFKIKTDGTGYAKLLDFSGTNGSNPRGSLFYDGTFLYGMTYNGGANNMGVIFKIKPDGTGYADMLDFNGANGAHSYGSLISDGTYLYGMTNIGGTNSVGLIFKIKTDGSGYSTLYDFKNRPNDGYSPYGSLISDGTFLYGMASTGGTTVTDGGIVFKFNTTCIPVTFSQSPTICKGQRVLVGTNTYSVAGTYVDVFPNVTASGCDSTVTTNLKVLAPKSSWYPTICQGQTISIGSHTYTARGTYIDTLTSYQGCDSIVTTHLIVLSSSSSNTHTFTICSGDSVTIGTASYTTSGTYTFTFQGSSCDSTIITSLTVIPTPTVSINGNTSICGIGKSTTLVASGGSTYLWSTGSTTSSIVVSPTKDTSYSVIAANGFCLDSSSVAIVVHQAPTAAFTYMASPPYNIFRDSSYIPSGNHIVAWQWYFPHGHPTTSTVQNPYNISYFSLGNDTVCLTVTSSNGCKDSICKIINVRVLAVNEIETESSIAIYPNPFSSSTTLHSSNLFNNASLLVYNCFGQIVKQIKNISGQTVTLTRDNLESGFYFIRLTEGNKILTVDKLVITDN
jgi:uncharacterized repeat protein (TIGR03803 family)